VNSEISEMCYDVPDWQTLELSKPALNRLRDKSLPWFKEKLSWAEGYFNEQRCENLDMVATYRPYHFNGLKFGHYLYVRYFTALLLNILETTKLTLREAHTFALECVQAHGAFHYLVERFAERYAPLSYLSYKREVYCHCWGTNECFEETLANVYVFQNHLEWDDSRANYLRQLYARQREGYVQAANYKELNLSVVYSQLEAQIARQDTFTNSSFLEQWIKEKTPFAADQLPIYLVNDGLKDSEFEDILELFFPSCLELNSN
jgi:hypothetical protein